MVEFIKLGYLRQEQVVYWTTLVFLTSTLFMSDFSLFMLRKLAKGEIEYKAKVKTIESNEMKPLKMNLYKILIR